MAKKVMLSFTYNKGQISVIRSYVQGKWNESYVEKKSTLTVFQNKNYYF